MSGRCGGGVAKGVNRSETMGSLLRRTLSFSFVAVGLAVPAVGPAAELTPPNGFRAIFNGRNLAGWHGLNPHGVEKLNGEAKQAALAQQRADFPKNWSVENGELVNDGHGPYATTDEEFGNIELWVDYKTVPKADSGIYLRGRHRCRSGIGTRSSTRNGPRADRTWAPAACSTTHQGTRRDPLVVADRPFGEWNRLRIRQIGDRTWVWLNDQLVVDDAVMENYWDRGTPLPARGPIMLQTHGGEIRWRNSSSTTSAREKPGRSSTGPRQNRRQGSPEP